jgi:hypothetical protein
MGLARLRVNQFDQAAYDPGMNKFLSKNFLGMTDRVDHVTRQLPPPEGAVSDDDLRRMNKSQLEEFIALQRRQLALLDAVAPKGPMIDPPQTGEAADYHTATRKRCCASQQN